MKSIEEDPGPGVGPDPRLPLHARIKDDLLRRIRAGEWNGTTPLPPESSLADSYEISIGTLRRVLGELATEGILERQQGRGTFVRRASFQNSLYRFFRVQGQEGQTPLSRILSRTPETADSVLAAALNVRLGSGLLHMRRLRLWNEHPFLIEDIWLPLPRFDAVAQADLSDLGPLLYPAYERLACVVVGSATEELSVVAATATQAALLSVAPDTALVRISRSALTHAGEIMEYRESHGVANSFRYRVEIS
ncbi:GntR family transcriptional regulator [Paeniglutamicibacter sp. MACA_103]|uniref:GntR family transcriptional regulator n=1 Tax=Paeniglutamicibacter sp. MACA_103 TaxID=3377337 RepID=UPI003893A7A6